MIKAIIAVWNKIPARWQKWLKGLEVSLATGIVSALIAAPTADFTTKAGWSMFLGKIALAAGTCTRLYLMQSPLQNVIAASQLTTEGTTKDGTTFKSTSTDVLTGPDSTLKP